jgi:integrase/recombinase XerD
MIIFQMSLAGASDKHIRLTKNRLVKFSEEMCYSCNLNDIIIYINKLKKKYSAKTLRKYVIDIRRLIRLIRPDLAEIIKLPKVPKRREIVIRIMDIQRLLHQAEQLKFRSERLRLRAAILLAATSGIRAEELYKLTLDNIDLENRTVYLRAEQTKDFEDRITFFSEEARDALIEYLNSVELKTERLFAECTVQKDFRKLDVEVDFNQKLRLKHMRKFFSQQSDRLGMPTSVKKLLMGHSTASDVDLLHYDFQGEEDLKKIYDKYWKDFRILG